MLDVKSNELIKKQLLNHLRELNKLKLNIDEYLIWGSSVLAIRGYRIARDLDIVVTKKCWEKLTKSYVVEGEKLNVIRIKNIEIWNDLLNLTDKLDLVMKDKDVIEGYPFLKLKYTLEWKEFLHREKDITDIQLIEELLK